MSAGYLLLEDGTVFRGRSVAADGVVFGEAVFTTGMTGYQETVTDPSYAGQLVCFTAPMVGNYGVADERGESATPHARAALMRRLGGQEWADWLRAHGLVGLDELDTRSLVLRLRDEGAMRACVVSDEELLSTRRRPRAGAASSRRWRGRSSCPQSRREIRTSGAPRARRTSRSSTTGRSARSSAGSPARARL